MFDDYKKSVILAYQKKMKTGDSINLLDPSPGQLRSECIIVYSERRLPKDEKILRTFFGSKDNLKDYSQNIDRFEIKGFKPLMNFIKGNTKNTDRKNVELLAWLIDFEPRPFDSQINYKEILKEESNLGGFENSSIKEDEEEKVPLVTPNDEEIDTDVLEGERSNDEIPGTETKNTEADPSNEGNKDAEETKLITYEPQPVIGRANGWKELLLKLKIRKAIVSFVTIIVAGGIAYYILNKKECMYWTGDQYQCIACNKKIGDTAIIALDTIKVAHLKKITRQDTLTPNSSHKVWYSKIDGNVEFFTSDGFHPIYTDRRLRPATIYIINKYAHPNKQPVATN